MHESTVSRVTTHKYVQTPRGLYELKYFFTSGLESESGLDISSASVKEMIKEMVGQETPQHPLPTNVWPSASRGRGSSSRGAPWPSTARSSIFPPPRNVAGSDPRAQGDAAGPTPEASTWTRGGGRSQTPWQVGKPKHCENLPGGLIDKAPPDVRM
jgi:hypothetical protein